MLVLPLLVVPQDKDSLKVITELPRSQSMKVLALLVGSLVIVVMKNERTLLHFHDMGKDHRMRKRKKRCKDCRHEMPIKSIKGSLIKAGKQEDLTDLMMDRISKGGRLS
nr:hypothetical protein [Tanacetum cinerariifolium]